MKVKLTKAQMLAQWKLRQMFEPLRADCTVSRSGGVDLDSYAALEMRRWYVGLLAEAPLELLAPKDFTLTAQLRRGDAGNGILPLPAGTVRVARVKLMGWTRPARIITDPFSPEALAMSGNRFARPGRDNPAAIVMPDGNLHLYPLSESTLLPAVQELWCVTDGGENSDYEFDERAWSLLPNNETNRYEPQ